MKKMKATKGMTVKGKLSLFSMIMLVIIFLF